ncbi:hypothetical protein [Aureivirga sp. CE67]|uniref:hypothetical protein n=1 Tax=Aureivirga sp. CE67 TaxID=1788983 RepID=UPI0018CAC9E6|nr:hypothetical protein [Aureivirga sp. CE67]
MERISKFLLVILFVSCDVKKEEIFDLDYDFEIRIPIDSEIYVNQDFNLPIEVVPLYDSKIVDPDFRYRIDFEDDEINLVDSHNQKIISNTYYDLDNGLETILKGNTDLAGEKRIIIEVLNTSKTQSKSLDFMVKKSKIQLDIEMDTLMILNKSSDINFKINKPENKLTQQYLTYEVLEGKAKLGNYDENIPFLVNQEEFKIGLHVNEKMPIKIKFELENSEGESISEIKEADIIESDFDVRLNKSKFENEIYNETLIEINLNSKDINAPYHYKIKFDLEMFGFLRKEDQLFQKGEFDLEKGNNKLYFKANRLGELKVPFSIHGYLLNDEEVEKLEIQYVSKVPKLATDLKYSPVNPTEEDTILFKMYIIEGNAEPYKLTLRRNNSIVYTGIIDNKFSLEKEYKEDLLEEGIYKYEFIVEDSFETKVEQIKEIKVSKSTPEIITAYTFGSLRYRLEPDIRPILPDKCVPSLTSNTIYVKANSKGRFIEGKIYNASNTLILSQSQLEQLNNKNELNISEIHKGHDIDVCNKWKDTYVELKDSRGYVVKKQLEFQGCIDKKHEDCNL